MTVSMTAILAVIFIFLASLIASKRSLDACDASQ